MGLDMYAFTAPADKFDDVIIDSDTQKQFYSQSQLLHDWRKHPNLHGWIEQNVYNRRGDCDVDFNCVLVKLSLEDLNDLEKAINQNDLPYTTGFFFGESQGDQDERDDDLEFIQKAKDAISKGLSVYYDSWW